MSTELADMYRQRAAEAHDRAVGLLTHYMQRAWEAAGLTWHGDNETEVALIVDNMVTSAVASIRVEMQS